MTVLRSVLSIQSTLSPYHPLLIEGHTSDARDPADVASNIVANVRRSWRERNVTKPPILVTQGDPPAERGISAISRIVGRELGVKRCLVCVDEDVDPEHARLADRRDVVYELRCSQLVDVLNGDGDAKGDVAPGDRLARAIDERIASLNGRRKALGEDDLAGWCRQYALLQGESVHIISCFGYSTLACLHFMLIVINHRRNLTLCRRQKLPRRRSKRYLVR